MFKSYPYLIPTILFLVIFSSCSPKLHKYESLLDGISAKPEVLTMHRDSVRVNITGALPLPLLNKDTKIYLFPEYRYGEGALRLGEFVAFDGTYTNAVQAVRLDEKITFPYLEGMDKGVLAIKALVFHKDKVFVPSEKELVPGVSILPLLTRLGQITPNEPIEEIGMYISTDFPGFSTNSERQFSVNFPLGSAQVPGRTLPTTLYNFLNRGERGFVIKKITVTGLVSPETAELSNPTLSGQRAENLKQRIKNIPAVSHVPVEIEERRNDFFDFRMLLRDYGGINTTQKDAYYQILTTDESFESQLAQIRQLSTFRKVSADLFPKLRTAQVKIELENSRFSDAEISASVYKMLKEGEGLEGFTKEHLIFAGQQAKRLEEKEKIYQKLVEIAPSVLAYNNLGVVFLNKAQRELDVRQKNIYISNALSNLREANRIQTNSISMHNIGRAYLLRKDYFEAYVAISEASGLERSETSEFLRVNEGLRGALDILNGDYRLATIRFNRAPESEVNYFNKGLAYFLAEDYRQAMIAFEESALLDRDFGYGFYGLALVAAVSNDEQALIENLQKAISRSEFLRERAMREVLFRRYWDRPAFIRVLK
ncbi:tetratricopeptide repeat protein [Arthrospiribacter ruber]|uniref:Tetratricopeptide repeat protein n=1 Tax=Arthrospiribacter ruber TaxID=2487934 RepID=A0A951J3I9_9BACT|nr:tetratricopeptide repeat protein [Arthrospiribacter ruber]